MRYLISIYSALRSYYDQADLVIAVGSRLEAFSTGSWESFPRGAGFIQIDIDPDTIAMNWRPARQKSCLCHR